MRKKQSLFRNYLTCQLNNNESRKYWLGFGHLLGLYEFECWSEAIRVFVKTCLRLNAFQVYAFKIYMWQGESLSAFGCLVLVKTLSKMDKFNKPTFAKGFSCIDVQSNMIDLVFKMIIGDWYQGAENIEVHCAPPSKSFPYDISKLNTMLYFTHCCQNNAIYVVSMQFTPFRCIKCRVQSHGGGRSPY